MPTTTKQENHFKAENKFCSRAFPETNSFLCGDHQTKFFFFFFSKFALIYKVMYTGLDQLVRERVREEQKEEREKGQKRLMEAKFKLQDTITTAAAAKLCCPLKTTFAPLLLMFDSLSNAILEHWQAANSGSSYRVYLCVLFLFLIFCSVMFCVR